MRRLGPRLVLLSLLAAAASAQFPPPSHDATLAPKKAERTIVLAGGCFWGVQAVFQHLRGVTKAVSGYSGGSSWTANYQVVSSGVTSHAESVQVSYDPSLITLGQILRVFFAVVHDPTQINRQGPDVGRHYRSAIFHADAEQKRLAEAYIAELDRKGVFDRKIATQVVPLEGFYAAESYHQNFAARHPEHPYIVIHDAPKIRNLRRLFPELYVGND
jgi:peptide-methionine (S)-S-oxide reductase